MADEVCPVCWLSVALQEVEALGEMWFGWNASFNCFSRDVTCSHRELMNTYLSKDEVWSQAP